MKTLTAYLITIACTVTLYYLLFIEHNMLFYINVVIACLAVGTLFLAFPLLSDESPLTFKKAASQYVFTLYGAAAFLWTSGYSLFITENDSLKTLYIGLLLTSIFFLLALTVTEIGGETMQRKEVILQTTVQKKKQVFLSIENIWLEIKEELCNHAEWEDTTLKTIRSILDKIISIPEEKLERNKEIVEDINTKLAELSELISSKIGNGTEEAYRLSITKKVNLLNNHIKNIKNIL